MGKLQLTLVTRNYDFIGPVACGDISPEGLDLRLVRDDAALELADDEHTLAGGEASFCMSVIRHANGDRRWIVVPVFFRRAFTQRHFFVLRGSGIQSLADLRGKRVGLEFWRTSGSTWCRGAVRESGVLWDDIEWHLGPLAAGAAPAPQGELPKAARLVSDGRGLQEMLMKGDLDAFVCWRRPVGFYEPDFPIVRLFPDYRGVEEEYYRRIGFCPGSHLLHIRRDLVKDHEWILSSLFTAFDRSMTMTQDSHRTHCETTPWMLAEVERVTGLLGRYWYQNGLSANRKMMDAFCEEAFVQKLTSHRVAVDDLFAEFIGATDKARVAAPA